MVSKNDAQQALDELRDLAIETNELANAFLLTGNTNVHFKLARFALRVHDRCAVLQVYVENKR